MLVEQVLADPLRSAQSDSRRVGYLGWNVPVELILASGATPVHLGHLTTDCTELAERFLESAFSAPSRAVAQRWLAGDLDALETVIFSRSDDSAQRLYYYLCELQRTGECKGPRPLLYDPARTTRASSVAHTLESTRSLAEALGTDERLLRDAIQRVAARESLLGELAALRRSDAVPAGSLANRIIRAARTDWSKQFDASLREWLTQPDTIRPRKRVLLVGSIPADERLHDAVEAHGCVVVGEINEACVVARSQLTTAMSDIEIVAHRYHHHTTSTTALLQSPCEIVKLAQTLRADGVFVWMLATDTGLAWEAPRIEGALHDVHLSTLMLTSQPQTVSEAALAQVDKFLRALEAS